MSAHAASTCDSACAGRSRWSNIDDARAVRTFAEIEAELEPDERERARARTAAPSTSPVSACKPLGMSSARTGASLRLIAAMAATAQRLRPARDSPMPKHRVDDDIGARAGDPGASRPHVPTRRKELVVSACARRPAIFRARASRRRSTSQPPPAAQSRERRSHRRRCCRPADHDDRAARAASDCATRPSAASPRASHERRSPESAASRSRAGRARAPGPR